MSGGCTYYSVDVEASGPVPGLYNLLSVGVTVVAEKTGGGWETAEEIYLELRPVFAGHDPRANAVHGLDLERLAREGLEPRAAMEALADFVRRTCRRGTEPVFVGHVAVFDWMMVAWYFAWCGLANPFGYKGIDTKSLAMGALGLPWLETSRETLEECLGLEHQDPETAHRADADARAQALLLIALLERARLRGAG
ncbi:MAG: 3'-5' exonuclease [Acidobacteriota bacterium]|nr:3'-5' exonuclease [Acidobacteriota bacterium]MDQ7086409.1 3'-5' exonuclease [Acidobacteriota bacterium]